MTEPAKSAYQVVDELAEENARLQGDVEWERGCKEDAVADRNSLSKAVAQAEHHFQEIRELLIVGASDEFDREWDSNVSAHVTAGLDACRNVKAGKEA